MRPLGDRQCEGCGNWYWRASAWQHDKCVVANTEPVVANKIEPKGRSKDRHKNKEARLLYARNLMRKRRAEAKQRAA